MPWNGQILALVGIILIIAEIFLPGFIVLPIGVGVLTASLWAFVFEDWAPILVLASFHALAAYLLINRYLKARPQNVLKTNTDSMIGQTVLVTEAIVPVHGGYVKLYGDSWKALLEGDDSAAVGQQVRIIALDGNKVIVSKV